MTTSAELLREGNTAELAEGLKAYRVLKEQGGPGPLTVTADQIPKEVKETMGLDLFPDDLQNDILALAIKITDYALHVADQAAQEGPFPERGAPFGDKIARFGDCVKKTVSWSSMRNDAMGSAGACGMLASGPLSRVPVPWAPAAAAVLPAVCGIAHAAGAAVGGVAGCAISKF